MKHLVGSLALAATIGCSSSTGANPAIALSLSLNGATVQQGASTQVIGTLTRSGGFAGSVSFSVSGAPTGVTATVGGERTLSNVTTATLTISVGSGAVPGLYHLVVKGQGSGVDAAMASFSLAVNSAPDFTLVVNPPSVSIVQGGNRSDLVITITRLNSSGAITLSLTAGSSAVPAGVTAGFVPAAPQGSLSTLTVTVAATTLPGSYNLRISGAGALGTRTTPFTLSVTAGSPSLGR